MMPLFRSSVRLMPILDSSNVDRPFADLTGKSAVVTGSSSGIGRAIARELALAGADVLVHYHQSEQPARELAEQLAQVAGRAPTLLQADLSDESVWESFVEQCWHQLGQIDTWVNNAGVDLLTGAERDAPPARKLRLLWEVDVSATFHLSRMVGRKMKWRGTGTIVNIGWDQADRGMEGDSGELFAASKNAVMGFSRSLAVSLAPEVRVNCIAPGWIKTAWGEQAPEIWQQRVLAETPLRRWGTPEDIARMARFLASDEAAFVTGQVINVNGGAVR
jgi:3-oxoacyl-[acyl-carrier protein] reductase